MCVIVLFYKTVGTKKYTKNKATTTIRTIDTFHFGFDNEVLFLDAEYLIKSIK